MGNVTIMAPQVNGSAFVFVTEDDSGARAVDFFCGDDTGAPVQHVVIEIKTKSGKSVRVIIPNDPGDAVVYMDDDVV